MGCMCGKPQIPPDPTLIGVWGSDSRVLQWNVGYGVYRVKKALVPLMKKGPPADAKDRARIEIKASGWISYVHVSSSKRNVTVVDMPATSWKQGAIEVACHEALQYHLHSDDCLSVNGLNLVRLA